MPRGYAARMERLYERVALTVCAGAMIVIAASTLAARVGAAPRNERYDEITVRRLRVVDASGATRLILTGKPIPEGTIDGKPIPRIGAPRDNAGMIFYNDNGDEQGGLTYSGAKGEQGASLTFDAWRQDQALELQHGSGTYGSDSYIAGNELPKESLIDVATAFMRESAALRTDEERLALKRRYRSEGKFGYQRWQIGNRGGASDVRLNDAKGHVRLRLSVAANGDARIEFLDASGAVVKSIVP
jgi:hypothetical protein